MNKNLWINKDIWIQLQNVFSTMKMNNGDLTMNRAINKIIKKGLIAFAHELSELHEHSPK